MSVPHPDRGRTFRPYREGGVSSPMDGPWKRCQVSSQSFAAAVTNTIDGWLVKSINVFLSVLEVGPR